MSEISTENWMGIIAIFSIFVWGIAILLFGQITFKHIEREMVKEGIEAPLWDKGIGGRIICMLWLLSLIKQQKPHQ